MATSLFSDRGFAHTNGIEQFQIKAIQASVDPEWKPSEVMTRNRLVAGWKQGLFRIRLSFEMDTPAGSPSPNIVKMTQGIQLDVTLEIGGDLYTVKGCVPGPMSIDAKTGEVNKRIEMFGTDFVDANQNTALGLFGVS
jgi:hypothetical protein